jgi:hypothetical protein
VRGNGRRKIRTEPLATDLEAAIIVRADRPDAIPWLFYSRVYLQVLAKYLRTEIEIVVQPLARGHIHDYRRLNFLLEDASSPV